MLYPFSFFSTPPALPTPQLFGDFFSPPSFANFRKVPPAKVGGGSNYDWSKTLEIWSVFRYGLGDITEQIW